MAVKVKARKGSVKKSKLIRKKTIPMVGSPVVKDKLPVMKKKPVVKTKGPVKPNRTKGPVKTKVKKTNTLKNKNIVDTKLKNVVPMIKKKVKQKVKNIKNSTPKQLLKKGAKFITNYSALGVSRKMAKKVRSVIKNRKSKNKPRK